ncbi:MAG TPA: hypothetical protein VJ698_07455 [Noviherbaspirillum sp.]|uniref:hypothetical protein n=1 Tax=Noviherbaspirillum sp. TaxID=1926288 RepID=UPI002B482E32|nr:hypothetical protein [Noviherbaspirillum sp.]HJV85298.1 hypothetical protein [Noviherbaspirillum sp.]
MQKKRTSTKRTGAAARETLSALVIALATTVAAPMAIAADSGKAMNPCAPVAGEKAANPCAPAKKAKKAKGENPCAPKKSKKAENPCAPKKD